MTTRPDDPRRVLAHRARRGRLVVKVGSSVLTTARGRLDHKTLGRLARDMAPLVGPRGPWLVSSGAIAVGVGSLGLSRRPRTMPGLQAAAAVGQSKLVEAWGRSFARSRIPVAQVLLTHEDLADRTRFLNARRALDELQRRRVVSIINENDTVSFEEIALGDNDRLAAQVANLVDADVLVLLTVADGLLNLDDERVPVVDAFDAALDGWVRPAQSRFGTGGMASKLQSVRIAAERGAHVVIAPGRQTDVLPRLLAGEDVGTLFVPPADTRMKSRAHWIAHSLRPAGRLRIDAGAAQAQRNQRSLLPKGVVAVEGAFSAGDCVDLLGPNQHQPLARGLVRYAHNDLLRIAGASSGSIATILGFTAGNAVVHRDDLVLLRAS